MNNNPINILFKKMIRNLLILILAFTLIVGETIINDYSVSATTNGTGAKLAEYALEQYPYSEGTNGYTKYGAYYKDPYGGWCCYFVSYCGEHTGCEGKIPIASNVVAYTNWFKARSLYHKRGTYTPKKGDVVFWDWDVNGQSEHVGIVTSVSGDYFYSIDGNTGDNNIKKRKVTLSYYKVMAYGEFKEENSSISMLYNYSNNNYIAARFTNDDLKNSTFIRENGTNVSTSSYNKLSLEKHNGLSGEEVPIRIDVYKPGSSGYDIGFRTFTNDGHSTQFGENGNFNLNFYADVTKATTMHIRWGFSSDYKTITLTPGVKKYNLIIDKKDSYNYCLHFYFDNASTVWMNEIQLNDGSNAMPYMQERKGTYTSKNGWYGYEYGTLPNLSRKG